MSDVNKWADSQQAKLDRVKDLLNEIIDNHKKMQRLLAEAAVKTQAERGIKDIESFLRGSDI